MKSPLPSTDAPPPLALAGLFGILLVLVIRCTLAADPFPAWSGDPMDLESPITGITPAWSLGLDAFTLLCSLVLLWGCRALGISPRLWESLALTAGAVPVALHSFLPQHSSIENVVVGSNWLASMGAAYSCLHACRDARLRRTLVAVLFGVVFTLVIHSMYQVLVEQPQVYKSFLADKKHILESQGWSEGSSMALLYQRRISQPEASGWFGMSNVFATIVAASMTFGASLLVPSFWSRKLHRGWWVIGGVATLTLLSKSGVYFAHSKGGTVAASLGIVLLLGCLLLHKWTETQSVAKVRRRKQLIGALAVAIPIAALVAVIFRGLLGEKLHELSLYFRYFYLQGAASIIRHHPLLGTGPADFKNAYMLYKPAISPEDVSSPHSIFFDFTATLGLAAVAWCLLILRNVYLSGAALLTKPLPPVIPDAPTLREEGRAVFLLFAAATAVSALFEHRMATIDNTVLRLIALVGATWIAVSILAAMRDGRAGRWLNIGLAVAAIIAITHCQIELTGITSGANLWVFLLLAAAAAPALADGMAATATPTEAVPVKQPSLLKLPPLVATTVLALSCAITAIPLIAVVPWETSLRDAASLVEPIPSLTARFNALSINKPLDRDTPQHLAADIGIALARSIPSDPRSISAALAELRYGRGKSAYARLCSASAVPDPSVPPSTRWVIPDFQTHRASSRLAIQLAAADPSTPINPSALILAERGREIAQSFATSHPSATAYAWLASVSKNLGAIDPDRASLHREQALEAFERAGELAPHEPIYPAEIARLHAQLLHPHDAATSASLALALDANLRLDPLRQFNAKDRQELERLAAGSAAGTPGPAVPAPQTGP